MAYRSRVQKKKSISKTLKITIIKIMPGDPSTMGSITAHCLAQDEVKPH
jgi:hypothetical protein